MENIKLFDLLKIFSPSEFENFGFFLDSPFLNGSKNAARLYKVISKFYPEFDKKRMTKQYISSKIYPGETFKDKKIRDLFSKTLELAENYMAFSKFKNQPLQVKSYSLSQLAEKNLDKHFEQKSREIETILNSMKIKDSNYYFYKYLLLKEQHSYWDSKTATGKREKTSEEINIEIEQFILFFVSNMLSYYGEQLNRQKMIKHNAHFELIDELMGYLEKKDLSKSPEILISYYTVLVQKNPDRVENYFILKDLVDKNTDQLERSLHTAAFIALHNFSKERSLNGDHSFKKEYFIIMKEMFRKNLYPMEDNYLPEYSYISVCGEGLIHGEYEWTANFIEEAKNLVRPEDRENAYCYCKATLNYRLKNYDKALKLLAKVKTIDFYNSLRVKNHFLKIYFETGQYESVLNNIDSFRHFLGKNKKIPDFLTSRFLNYVNFSARICNSILVNDISNLNTIKEEIAKTPNVENRTWMTEQINIFIASKTPKIV